jgi:molybdate transport system substrate-binding protein
MAAITAGRIVCGDAAKPACAVIALAAAIHWPGIAAAADVRVFTSGAPAEAEKAIAATFSAATGHRIIFTVGTPGAIKERLDRGEKADVLLLPAGTLAAMEGALRPGGAVAVARVGVGVVVRQGAPLPDIATPDAVKKLLLAARSIVMPDPGGGGFAAGALLRMMAELGIADAVRSKTTLRNAIAGGVALVANGDADVGLFNISEIITVAGIRLVGPLPPALQSYISFAAAVPADAREPQPALAYIAALTQPAAGAAWTAAGLEPSGN